ncbi:hypothetical protein BB559_003090 [Furculomyces boomerangus]|uniref:Phosphatidylglycerol/phosphatidylinositol transfer protein n=2 Tax=Harpellales TaxID=61421 RepID=A0A2T9YPB3_9FUNG|nr:hypothetical protein BB559_003090 [Furculomyces boomerangus]PVZ96889.1 hypothetical protein BB558_007181 [Smittium angustum]
MYIRSVFVLFLFLSISTAAIWNQANEPDNGNLGMWEKTQRIFGKVRKQEEKKKPLNEIITDYSDEDDLMDIHWVNLDPEQPARSINLTVTAEAYIKERIEHASANVIVKYGWIRLVNRDYDLCQLLEENSNLRCPLDPGTHNLSVVAQIPGLIPPGWFTIEAVAKRNDDVQIGKVIAVVSF